MNPNLDLDTTISCADELACMLRRAHSAATPTASLLLLDLIGQARAIHQRLKQIATALEEEDRG